MQKTDTHISMIISNPSFPKTVVTDNVSGAQVRAHKSCQ